MANSSPESSQTSPEQNLETPALAQEGSEAASPTEPTCGGARTMDMVCPFHADKAFCLYPMAPKRDRPTPREYKLLGTLGEPVESETKIGCNRCAIFRKTWKAKMGPVEQLQFLLRRLRDGGKDLFRGRGKRAA